MCILYSLNYTVIKSVKTHAPQQVIWRESSKSLYSAVGTIFHLGGGGVCQSNCDDTLSEWSGAILPRQSLRFWDLWIGISCILESRN